LELMKITGYDVYWWGRIKVDHDNKKLYIYWYSQGFGKLSDNLVEWMLKEYKDKWYEIKIEMWKGY
jgi:hypothetical protein